MVTARFRFWLSKQTFIIKEIAQSKNLLELAVVGLGAAFALAGCHSTPALTAQQAEGKHLYDIRCAHCHEDNDLNLKKVPPNLHAVFMRPNLPSGDPATDVNVERVVLAGKGLMPAFAGRFSNEQMAALLAYLHAGLRPEGP